MLELTQFIDAATPLRALGVVVTQNGKETARHTWEGACLRKQELHLRRRGHCHKRGPARFGGAAGGRVPAGAAR